MNDEQTKDVIVKGPKWAKDEVYKFFDMLNKNPNIYKKLANKDFNQKINPIRLKDFKYPENVKQKVVSTDFNAYTIIDAGHVYDDYGKQRAKTTDERIALAKKKLSELVKAIENTIAKSSNPMFKCIGVKVLNKDFDIVRTYEDPYDDGDDYFGLEVFLKFCYKK